MHCKEFGLHRVLVSILEFQLGCNCDIFQVGRHAVDLVSGVFFVGKWGTYTTTLLAFRGSKDLVLHVVFSIHAHLIIVIRRSLSTMMSLLHIRCNCILLLMNCFLHPLKGVLDFDVLRYHFITRFHSWHPIWNMSLLFLCNCIVMTRP